ncbi:polyketide synthase dehydratase domain-containing protein [Paenibacillus vortex]|uniref:polyketide synthase dehydratase domain-containing protein n=1 Tax=Paenibacillus vortex TaxID=71995 RepID=UPI003FA685E3
MKKQFGEQSIPASRFYEVFNAMGMDYGPAHRGIEEAYKEEGSGQILAKLSIPSIVTSTLNEYVLHPSLMDSALQATIGFLMSSEGEGRIPDSVKPVMPFALQELYILGDCTPNMWAWIRSSDQYAAATIGKTQKLDIDLCDEQGRIRVRMRGFSTRVLEGESQASSQSNAIRQESHAQLPCWEYSSRPGMGCGAAR